MEESKPIIILAHTSTINSQLTNHQNSLISGDVGGYLHEDDMESKGNMKVTSDDESRMDDDVMNEKLLPHKRFPFKFSLNVPP